MRELHRINTDRDAISVNKKRRALKLNGFNTAKRRHILVLDAGTSINGSRCIISADQAVHFCGFAEEVNEPPILPHLNGICQKSLKSERNICYPRYEELDSSCTDAATSNERSGLVAPPVIPNAFVQVMAFVPPDNLKRLIRQYYRNHGKPYPRNETEIYSARSFLFVKYGCDPGYELQDEADTMFCRDRVWVQTPPICKGKGLCEVDNGGCSHSCLQIFTHLTHEFLGISFEQNRTLECRCPKGLVLDANGKTCIKPVPKSLCRKLSGCVCSPVDEKQLSCSCPNAEKCLLVHGRPKVYLDPPPDYQVEPGGNLNITCSAVAFPFPEIVWEREQEDTTRGRADVHLTTTGTNIRSEQLLIIKQIYKNTNFTCHAHNEIGETSRLVRVVVTGPGSAPVLRQLTAGRTRIEVHWEKPHVINRPLTAYALYFTTDPMLPIKSWSQVNVSAPAISHVIHGLNSDTLYTIRVRAHDSMGPGKLSNPVSVRTLPPAIRPFVFIPEGTEIRVPPRIPFTINCNLSRGEPIPDMYWESRSRNISIAQQGRHIALQHTGLYENSEFFCVAENEAGRTVQKVFEF
uniref:Ig-like domain-containing protein n=1 Tax=Meloidogyne incognita TaxID=6306 RepID=A0A914L7B6_MELIC